MKIYLMSFLVAAAFVSSGCDPLTNVSSASRRAGDVIVDDTVGSRCGAECEVSEESSRRLRDILDRADRDRRHDWHDHNDRWHGGQPGWGRGGGGFPYVSMAENAPAPSAEYRQLCRMVAKTYGVSDRAAWLLMEGLNRAAVGDFGGLRNLGLSENSFANIAKHRALSQQDLQSVASRLGISANRTNALIQHIARRL